MTRDGDDDRALLTRHAAGDTEAFALLVTRHRDRLWRVALRTLGNPDDAADAVQDALVSAYRSAAGFRGDSAVTTWLHRIVVNACLDLARKRAARPVVPLPEQPTADPVAAALQSAFFAVTNGDVPDSHGWLTYVYAEEAHLREPAAATGAKR